MSTNVLSDGHYKLPFFRQRITIEQWKKVLLNEQDTIFYNGKVTQLVADDMGYGVVEVYKGIHEKEK